MTEKTNPLEGLAAEADALTPPLGEGTTMADVAERERQEQEAAQPDNAQLLAGMFNLARDTVVGLADVQSLKRTLSDAQTAQLGAMWGQVLDSYGIRLNDYMGRHGPLIAATLATVAIGVGVVKGYREEVAARTPPPAPSPLPDVPAA